MHRYRPKLHIVCTDTGEVEDFDFEETAFMAVTAYQNPQVLHAVDVVRNLIAFASTLKLDVYASRADNETKD